MIKGFCMLSGLILVVCFALGCGGYADGSDESFGGSGGSNAAGAAGQAGQGGQSTGGAAGVGGSSSDGGSGGSISTGGSAGSAGVGGSDADGGPGGSAGQGGQAGSSGMGGSAGAAGSENDGGSDADAEPPNKQLHVLIAAEPVSSTVVKKSIGVPAVGLNFKAPQDTVVSMVQLRCQASIAGQPYQSADCASRVTSIALFDGDDQVGLAMSPTANGDAFITQMNWLVPKGGFKTLTAKVSLSSVATVDEPFDRVSVGLVAATAQDAVTDEYVPIAVDWNLAYEQLSDAPLVTTTIRPSGTLKIQADGHPAPQIVVAGKDAWVPFARYRATAEYENASMDMLLAFFCTSVVNGCEADNFDFSMVAAASNGVIHGVAIPPANNDWWVNDLYMFADPILVPKDGSVSIELWGKLNPITPFGVGPVSGQARSGHAPALGLVGGYHSQDWDAAYIDKVNVRTTGLVSGERLYADNFIDMVGKPMTLRMTQPIVVKQQLANPVLTNGNVELVRFQVAADSAGPVALRQMSFVVEKPASLGLDYPALFRGNFPVADGAHTLTVQVVDSEILLISVVWDDGAEEMVAGSGFVYSLRANVSGVAANTVLRTTLVQGGDSVATGYLHKSPTTGLVQLCGEAAADPDSCPFAGFGWSDGSGKSTWGYQVQDLPLSQILTH
jgi:hypothetical protein